MERSMINWSRMEELFEDFGADGFADVAEVFVEEVTESLNRLSAAQDPDSLRAEFHFLKGAALNLGFDDIARLCAEGEEQAARNQPCTAQKAQVLTQMPATCDAFLQQWPARLSGRQGP